jgi:hypothetical protein
MTKENSESQITPAERALRRQDLSALTEFLWQALKEIANLLMKAVAFPLAIMAAILRYVLSHPVAPSIRIVALSQSWLIRCYLQSLLRRWVGDCGQA